MARDVGRAAQKGGVPEREQARVAQQQVEGAGEQGVAHDLHDEDGVGARRRQQGDDDNGQQIGEELTFHFSFPNRPAGRISKTLTMIMKTTVLEASGQNTLVSPSLNPRPKTVTMGKPPCREREGKKW